ncbi:hypothetical protein ACWDAO_26495 [Streptomyces sp. NPDC001212]
MTEELKPYPDYRASGLPWCPEIPSHWTVRRNGGLFSQRLETGYPDLPILEVSLRTGVRVRDMAGGSRKQVMSQREKYKRAAQGDIAYNMMRMWQGAVGTVPTDGLVSPAYVVAQPLHGTLGTYYSHLFRTDAYLREVNKYSRGIVSDRNRLYWGDFKQMPSLLPSLTEQELIVKYLHNIQLQVGSVIRAKGELISLLTEQKQALAHQTVLRGLDANVKLRDSGSPWLGSIPDHWGVYRLKNCVSPISQGWSPQCEAIPASDGEWGVLTVGCVNGETFAAQKNKRLPEHLAPRPDLQVSPGDILMSRANTRTLLGRATLVEGEHPGILISDKLFRFRAHEDIVSSRFLVHLLRTGPSRAQIESSTNGASDSMQNISQGVVRNLVAALPPRNEQEMIASHLAEAFSPIDIAIQRAERETKLLWEYQTRLTADVVTGRLDVRAAAAALPDVDAPEAYDLKTSPLEGDAEEALGMDTEDDNLGEEGL